MYLISGIVAADSAPWLLVALKGQEQGNITPLAWS
jgi:hypothetical protein